MLDLNLTVASFDSFFDKLLHLSNSLMESSESFNSSNVTVADDSYSNAAYDAAFAYSFGILKLNDVVGEGTVGAKARQAREEEDDAVVRLVALLGSQLRWSDGQEDLAPSVAEREEESARTQVKKLAIARVFLFHELCNSDAEIAQMVCGACRRLLKYPRGARNVQCSCCQTVNFVLEAYEIGQVKCGSCAVLLMYQYGASSVRCSSCCFVTEIGAHNRRPPWSVQQGQPPLHPISFH
ncbi:hypothetical protein FEM48_Zijuj01G0156000 [Ziziphus jujuba var. spinosa]|uniref:Zinc finger LSD1-type domain-containing protein n=1 Tax=Ziziphus jujuba var. spinosa TaxID=714518 RepID=A0A978W231_ZIZJJ|nr:hypothetical protein FEM48_Zijuj01G0156000 [Ziziphus jujuba var. spinosa]